MKFLKKWVLVVVGCLVLVVVVLSFLDPILDKEFRRQEEEKEQQDRVEGEALQRYFLFKKVEKEIEVRRILNR